MVQRLPLFLLGAALAAALISYGGFGSPNLIHFLIASAALVVQTTWPKEYRLHWPIPGRLALPAAVLLAGVCLQTAWAPNQWLTLQSLLWLIDALLLSAIILTRSPFLPSIRGWVSALLAAGVVQLILLPFSARSDFTRTGTFINPNHTAAFLTMCFWLTFRLSRPLYFGAHTKGAQWRTLFTALFAASVVVCFSMGASLALLIAVALFLLRHKISPRKTVPAILLLLVASQVIFAYVEDRTAGKVLSTLAPTKVNDATRRGMIRTSLALFREHPIVGNGLGSFEARFPSLADIETTDRVAQFAHQDFLQLLSEVGLPLFLVAGFLLWLLFGSLHRKWDKETIEQHRLRQATFWIGVTLTIHSLVDFPWHVPLIFLGFVGLAALSLSPHFGDRKEGRILLPLSAVAAAFALFAGVGQFLLARDMALPIAHHLLPGNSRPAKLLAREAMKARRAKEAQNWAHRAVEREQFDADAREIHAASLAADGNAIGAATEMDKAASLDPKNGNRLIRTSTWLMSHGFGEYGLRAAARMRSLQTYWRRPCFKIVSILAPDPYLLDRCIDPTQSEARRDIAVFLEERHQMEAAYDIAYGTLPDGLTEAWLNWFFRLATATKLQDDALARVVPLGEMDAKNPWLHHLAGKLLADRKDWRAALREFTEAARHSSYPASVWQDAKGAFESIEDLKACREIAETWLLTWPQSAYPFLAAAVCSEREGKVADALLNVEKAIKIDVGIDDAWGMKLNLWIKRGVPERSTAVACDAARFRPTNKFFQRMCNEGRVK